MAYIDIDTLIPNTTMRKFVSNDNVDLFYEITVADGYVLHSKSRDWKETDPETDEETLHRGYGHTMTTAISYDFDNTKEIDGYIAYGEKEIFAREIAKNISYRNN